MPRKQEKIKCLTPRDKEFLQMIKVTGACTPGQANQATGISEARADMLVKSKLMNVEGSVHGKIYSATDKGVDASGGGSKYHRAGLQHDLTLAKEYIKIPKDERSSARTGTSCIGGSNSKGSPDLIYTNSQGEDIGIEIETENYTTAIKELKTSFANEHNITLNSVQADRRF